MINVSLIVLFGLAAVALARWQSAAFRHWVLAAAIGCAAVSPLLDRVLPAWNIGLPGVPSVLTDAGSALAPAGAPLDSTAAAASAVRAQPVETAEGPGRPIAGWLRRIWILGTVVSVLVLAIGIGRLMYLAKRAERLVDGPWPALAAAISREYGLQREVVVLQSRHPALLVTWGVLRPRIMLPAGAQSWPGARARVVLCHELAHIQRGDWIPQLLALALRSAFWFNPLLWIASRRLRLESEQACDDAVLRSGIPGPEYAAHLLDLARAVRQHRLRPFPGFPAPAMARPCSLERRVTAMLSTHRNRTATTASGRIVTASALLAVTVLVAGATAQGRASFTGSVLDPLHAPVPGSTVTLTSVQTGAKSEVHTDRDGRFEFNDLGPGDYLFEARLTGFALLSGRVTVSGQHVQKDLGLRLGSLQETITVATSRGTVPSEPRVRQQSGDAGGFAPCTPTGSGGNIRPPRKVKDVRPVYPQAASDTGIGGTVIVDAIVGADGFVGGLTVREAASPDLAGAALEAIRLWEFTPTLLNCMPVDVAMTVRVTFEVRH